VKFVRCRMASRSSILQQWFEWFQALIVDGVVEEPREYSDGSLGSGWAKGRNSQTRDRVAE
jgi:hypothetical protein